MLDLGSKIALALAALALALYVFTPVSTAAPELVRYLGGFSANEDSFVRNGYDIIFYTDDRATDTIVLDGALGDIEHTGVFRTAPTSLTITGTQTITPSAGVLTLAPATALTLTLSGGAAETGDYLLLHNAVTTSTVVVDTGATQGGGSITLGLNDLAWYIYLNGVWIELTSPDNS